MRALLLILDGVGCGSVPDAPAFGDENANTLGNLLRIHPGLSLPALYALGLWKLLTADVFDARSQGTLGRWGRMRSTAPGKDSVSGHWEIAGVTLDRPFAATKELSTDWVRAVEADAGMKFTCAQHDGSRSVLDQFGTLHVQSKEPILYFGADSVLEVAAHESVLAPTRLYDVCRIVRRCANGVPLARVIARPFSGEPGTFRFLDHKGRDFPMVPPRTVLNAISETGLPVIGIGKIGHLFAGSGITKSTPTLSNLEGLSEIDRNWDNGDDGLIFANLSDFDRLGGHLRDPDVYARLLMEFDVWLDDFLARVETDDLVIITSDHGNDPTFHGAAHTREEVPLLVLHGHEAGPLGTRKTYADVAATLADFFQLRQGWRVGSSFLHAAGMPVIPRKIVRRRRGR